MEFVPRIWTRIAAAGAASPCVTWTPATRPWSPCSSVLTVVFASSASDRGDGAGHVAAALLAVADDDISLSWTAAGVSATRTVGGWPATTVTACSCAV
jgi:hypothetical protein